MSLCRYKRTSAHLLESGSSYTNDTYAIYKYNSTGELVSKFSTTQYNTCLLVYNEELYAANGKQLQIFSLDGTLRQRICKPVYCMTEWNGVLISGYFDGSISQWTGLKLFQLSHFILEPPVWKFSNHKHFGDSKKMTIRELMFLYKSNHKSEIKRLPRDVLWTVCQCICLEK